MSSVSSGTDRLAQITYGLDAQTGSTDAYLIASNLGSVSPTDDLANNDNFSVISVAKLLDVGYTSIDMSKNLALIKTNGLS